MTDFQLYKKREFSDLIGDTLNFFKQHWKNFLQNYILLNGVFLLLFAGIYFLLFKDMFTNMFNPQGMQQWTMQLVEEPFTFGGLLLLFSLFSVVLSVLLVAFPMAYLKLIETNGSQDFTLSEIWKEVSLKLGKIFIFGLISLVILVPIFLVVMVVGILFSIVIIGIPFLILALPTALIWSFQSMYFFVNDGADYFKSLKLGWKATFNKYWHLVGATVILYFCITVFTSIFSSVPMIISMASVTTTGTPNIDSSFGMLFGAFYSVAILVSNILSNLIYVQQGLIFYSSKENNVNVQAFSDIESIGRNED